MIYRQVISSIASVMGMNGHHFKVLYLSEDAKAIFRGENWSLRTDIKAGLTLDLSSYGSPITEIEFSSDNAQNIRFWCGKAKAEDSSMSGAIAVDSANSVNYFPKKDITVATEIFTANTARLAGTYQITNDCYVNDAVDGIRLPAGVYQWTNKQPMVLIPVTGTVTVKSMDELF